MKIFINPGHCVGVDPGAVGHGLEEARVVLDIGNRAADYLRAVGYAVKVFQYDGLREIAEDANDWGADIFISIHCNAARNESARGTETFYWNGGSGKGLAKCVNAQIVKAVGTVDRGLKTANFTVLGRTNMPAILVETAFITNAGDADILANRADDFARAIARGVTDYVKETAPLPDVIDTHGRGTHKLSEHFDAAEFACHHCGAGADKIRRRLVDLLEELRANIGKPLHVNSGYRCPVHNMNVGGVPDSQHVRGTAADIATPAGMSFETFKRYVVQLPFDGIGFYPPIGDSGSFIHVDVRNGGVGAHIYWEG